MCVPLHAVNYKISLIIIFNSCEWPWHFIFIKMEGSTFYFKTLLICVTHQKPQCQKQVQYKIPLKGKLIVKV